MVYILLIKLEYANFFASIKPRPILTIGKIGRSFVNQALCGILILLVGEVAERLKAAGC